MPALQAARWACTHRLHAAHAWDGPVTPGGPADTHPIHQAALTLQRCRALLVLLLLLVAKRPPALAHKLGDLCHTQLAARRLELRLCARAVLVRKQKIGSGSPPHRDWSC